MIRTTTKDPASVEDFRIDWSSLAADNAITDSVWDVPAGLTKDDESATGTVATVRLSGGTDGQTYRVVNTVTLTDGQVIPCAIRIEVSTE